MDQAMLVSRAYLTLLDLLDLFCLLLDLMFLLDEQLLQMLVVDFQETGEYYPDPGHLVPPFLYAMIGMVELCSLVPSDLLGLSHLMSHVDQLLLKF
jgi:hypothetical protein